MKSFIKIRFQTEGVHRWTNCPFHDVFYLKNYHRHIFHFEVEMSVTELDREIEFIRLKNELSAFADDMLKNPVDTSCEQMAAEILIYLQENYGKRHYKICVFEDGENGGGVESD